MGKVKNQKSELVPACAFSHADRGEDWGEVEMEKKNRDK